MRSIGMMVEALHERNKLEPYLNEIDRALAVGLVSQHLLKGEGVALTEQLQQPARMTYP